MIRSILLAALAVDLAPVPPPLPPALPTGWSLQKLTGISGPEALVCTGARAYVRSWSGDVSQFDGATWSTLPRLAESAYGRSLAASPDGHVFLEAGSNIVEWDGAAWVTHPLDRWDGDLDGQFAAEAASEVYYVGRGRVARRTASGFATFGAGTWRSLSAVAVVGPDLWVGGQGGTVLQFNGSTWTRQDTRTDRWIRRLIAFSPTDVWALADGATYNQSTILHWDGSTWRPRDRGLPANGPVEGLGGAPDKLYAAGDFGLARWSGDTWTLEIDKAALGPDYHALDDVCATDRHILVSDKSGNILQRAR